MSDEIHLDLSDAAVSDSCQERHHREVCVSGAQYYGIPSSTDADRLFSPSFSRIVEDVLPLPPSGERVTFGGQWFWELYQHAVLGEHAEARLGGSGVNLVEDSLEAQKRVRAQGMHHWQTNSRFACLWTHYSAKLEVVYALALSIALRVVREPMLEDNQGPQAVILCATKDQCDEVTFALNRFCTDLHLVAHNLFEPYPAMPVGKRAEIVVGTPPLWEGVCVLPPKRLPPGAKLEDLLVRLFPRTPPPTYSASHLRPYSLQHVIDLAFFDVNQQVHQGFAGLVDSVTQRAPLSCRLTRVYSGIQTETVGSRRFLSGRSEDQKRVSVLSYAPSSSVPRKRKRDETMASETSPARLLEGEGDSALTSGLLLWNALSTARLLLDHETFTEFRNGVESQALCFWERFEGKSVSSTDLAEFVQFHLCLVCCTDPHAGDESHAAYMRDVCLAVLPTPKALQSCASRLPLLFSHLEDHLSGSLFDGSVVTCTNISSAPSSARQLTFATHETPIDASVVLLCEHLCEDAAIPTRIVVETAKESPATCPLATTTTTQTRTDAAAVLSNNTASDDNTDSSSTHLPRGFFLPNECPTHPFTVVVVRHVAASIEKLCMTDAGAESKPMALTFLEECCQYGRVLSYYCHQDYAASDTTASLFVEYETEASATEAVRLLSYRFGTLSGPRSPSVRLFRNTTYYEGVRKNEQKQSGAAPDDPADDLFDDVMSMDLLSE